MKLCEKGGRRQVKLCERREIKICERREGGDRRNYVREGREGVGGDR